MCVPSLLDLQGTLAGTSVLITAHGRADLEMKTLALTCSFLGRFCCLGFFVIPCAFQRQCIPIAEKAAISHRDCVESVDQFQEHCYVSSVFSPLIHKIILR